MNESLRLRVLAAKNVIRAAKASGIQLVVSRNQSSISVVDALGLDGFRIHIIVTCIDVLRHLGTASKELDEIQKELEVMVGEVKPPMQAISCAICHDTGLVGGSNDIPCNCEAGRKLEAVTRGTRKAQFLEQLNLLIQQLQELVLLAKYNDLPEHKELVQGLTDVLAAFLDGLVNSDTCHRIPKSQYDQCKDCKGTAGDRNGNPGSSWKCCPPLKGPCTMYEKEVP